MVQHELSQHLRACVPSDKTGLRLDRFLTDTLEGLSRNRVQALLADGHVRCDGEVVSGAKTKVQAGQVFEITVPAVIGAVPQAQAIPLDVVYEDDDIIVINKPPGLVVHPAAGNPDRTLVNALLAHCGDSLTGVGGVARPGIVHRLDKGTSGLMVAAKNDRAHAGLTAQFAAHTVERAYRAVVWGVPRPTTGTVEGNIGRSPHNRKKMAIVERGGKRAVTHYKVEQRFKDVAAMVECRLETGRTHQIRVHMASIGHPLVGDPLYGSRRGVKAGNGALRQQLSDQTNQVLHAFLLGFMHPVSGEKVVWSAENPLYFNAVVEVFKKE